MPLDYARDDKLWIMDGNSSLISLILDILFSGHWSPATGRLLPNVYVQATSA
jgi:hypothetical protein